MKLPKIKPFVLKWADPSIYGKYSPGRVELLRKWMLGHPKVLAAIAKGAKKGSIRGGLHLHLPDPFTHFTIRLKPKRRALHLHATQAWVDKQLGPQMPQSLRQMFFMKKYRIFSGCAPK